MRKTISKEILKADLGEFNAGFISNVESFKRQKTLQSFWSLDMSSKIFFKRVLHVKRGDELVFITKAQGRGR